MNEPGTRQVADYSAALQGLRAVAVLAVVAYHVWPDRLTGGYVGVDVFFVISGFLITSHLLRDTAVSGKVKLARFWARRIRRLLPAAFLVLVATAVATVIFAPQTIWTSTAREVVASAFYIENWLLAGDAVDYLAADAAPSAVQHYWSLSVEEQFYVVWPVLILLAVWVARRLRRLSQLAAIRAAMIVVVVASLAWSVYATAASPASAYFVTTTRVWEFAAGGLVAVFAARPTRAWVRNALGWGGMVAIVAACWFYTNATPFPGYTALLPVAGTVAVILAGDSNRVFTASFWLGLRPARFIGDISYSIYLWHWPLIILWPLAFVRTPGLVERVVIVGVTILLAWGTKVWVEDPLRFGRLLGRAPWRAFVFAGAGMATIVGVYAALTAYSTHIETRQAAEHAEVVAEGCYGPAALDPASGCDPVVGDGPVWPGVGAVYAERFERPFPGCQAGVSSVSTDVTVCTLGDGVAGEPTVAVIGDSHATHWFPLFAELSATESWTVYAIARSSCPISDSMRVLDGDDDAVNRELCAEWVDNVIAEIASRPEIDAVFVSSRTSAYEWTYRDGSTSSSAGVDGFVSKWNEIIDLGVALHWIADLPIMTDALAPNCVAGYPDDRTQCSVARDSALAASDAHRAAALMDSPQFSVIDFSNQYCDAELCHAIVGDMLAYFDSNHTSESFARALAPYLLDQIEGRAPESSGEDADAAGPDSTGEGQD